jgi:hypothetical protein
MVRMIFQYWPTIPLPFIRMPPYLVNLNS